ncbi:CoA-binding protein [Marinoscillum sp. MHG1-6]|uniref:CoA-binding protein n=1 Tax=Marinoscillum sp. MHG1-6 TaxID=2959627 RepID=UPI0021582F6D|nr:CoA-binding protein [Marinoscillum sp. MHG1-6]
MSKKTAIIGATPHTSRFAYLAAERLTSYHHEIVPLGIRKGNIFGKEIMQLSDQPEIPNIDTMTLYINPDHQKEWEDYLLSLSPKRIIFNPGTENPDLARRAANQGIETVNGCTLVMLSSSTY